MNTVPWWPLFVSLSVLSLQGCASGERLTLPIYRSSERDLKVWTVEARDVGEEILVSGIVTSSSMVKGPVAGHLHVIAGFVDGRPVQLVESRWGSMTSGLSRMAGFHASLPIADSSSIAFIAVKYVIVREGGSSSDTNS